MILILSERQDYVTDQVIGFLHRHGVVNWTRLNVEDIFTKELSFEVTGDYFVLDGREIKFSDVTTVWYRRFGTKVISDLLDYTRNKVSPIVANQLSNEYKTITQFLCYRLRFCKWLNHFTSISVNKLEVLHKASELGIPIPGSYITSQFKSLLDDRLITKSVFEPCFFTYKRAFYATFTNTINKAESPNKFFPSLLQHKVEKAYEVRSFYLAGNFYSMAIFSQAHKETALDFRKYVDDIPVRFVPYDLPKLYKSKLRKLMRFFNLSSGSIDIIVDTRGELIFLEVNPVGQFGMLESRCNYGIYKILADKLIDYEQTENTHRKIK